MTPLTPLAVKAAKSIVKYVYNREIQNISWKYVSGNRKFQGLKVGVYRQETERVRKARKTGSFGCPNEGLQGAVRVRVRVCGGERGAHGGRQAEALPEEEPDQLPQGAPGWQCWRQRINFTEKTHRTMKKQRIIELAVKVLVAALTAFLTAIGTTSCMGHGPF